MTFSRDIKCLLLATLAVTVSLSANADTPDPALRERSSEAVVLRGGPQNITTAQIAVYIPGDASDVQVRAYMKNEIWGGRHVPPKPNTDDMGTTNFIECPMGNGDCPIAFSAVGLSSMESLPTGMTKVSATFSNWVGRNDRTGKLVVTYRIAQ